MGSKWDRSTWWSVIAGNSASSSIRCRSVSPPAGATTEAVPRAVAATSAAAGRVSFASPGPGRGTLTARQDIGVGDQNWS
jgi:hypothetical protein